MRIKRLHTVVEYSTLGDFALLLLRVVAGVAFMMHGWGKVQNPLDWMGPGAFAPAPFQALAALAEFGGGLAWVLGLFTPIASFGIVCTMTVAVYAHACVGGDPFVSMTGGPAYEQAAVYFSVAVLLIAFGPGRYSADRRIFGVR